MATEIEKRFLLLQHPPLTGIVPAAIRQGYLAKGPDKAIRIRQKDQDAFLTIKGPRVRGENAEFEYPVPFEDSIALMAMCGSCILTKDRYALPASGGLIWEVDLFTGRHAGLMIAEIEIPAHGHSFDRPAWLGPDITDDNRFGNANLVDLNTEQLRRMVAEYMKPAGPALKL